MNFILGGDDHPPAHPVWKRQVLSQNNYAAIKTHWFKLETAHSDEEGRPKGHAEAEAELVDNELRTPRMRQRRCRNVAPKQPKQPFPIF